MTDLKFNRLKKNTEELIFTVRELFPDVNVTINNVEGNPERFKADLSANISTEMEPLSNSIVNRTKKL